MATNFPTSLDTAATMHDVRNNLSTTLASAYTAPDTSLVLADASGFPITGGIIYVGGERTTYTVISSNTLTITALSNSYASGTTVEMLLDAAHHNDLRLAVIALETKVGADSSAVTSSLDYKVAQLPSLSSSNPVALGSAGPGTGSTAARTDHVHPTTGLGLTSGKLSQFAATSSAELAGVISDETGSGALVFGTAPTISDATFTNGYTEETFSDNAADYSTIALTNGTIQTITLDQAATTLTFPANDAGKSFLLIIKQDGTGSRTITWDTDVKWPSGTAPTLTATASKADVFSFVCDGTYWYGVTVGQNYL